MSKKLTLFFLILLPVFLIPGCNNNDSTINNNTNNQNNTGIYRLLHNNPASGELNLMTGVEEEISIQLLDSENKPISGHPINFLIKGSAGGSSLSKNNLQTNKNGLASVVISTGKTSSHFTIAVSCQNAAPINFDVIVSSTGQADFTITPSYDGIQPEAFHSLDFGIIFNSTCDDINNNSYLNRIKKTYSLEESVKYESLPVDFALLFVVRGYDSSGKLIASGCKAPDPENLIPGNNLQLEIELLDYLLYLSEETTVFHEVETNNLSSWIQNHFINWLEIGRCNYGFTATYLNCLISHLEGGDPLTCSEGVETALSARIKTYRGLLNSESCRGFLNSYNGISLERTINDLSPGVSTLQNNFKAFKISLNQNNYEHLSLKSNWENHNDQLIQTFNFINFPLINQEYTEFISPPESRSFSLEFKGNEPSPLLISQSFIHLSLIETVKTIIRELFFKDTLQAIRANEVKARFIEYIDEISSLSWQEELIDIIDSELTWEQIETSMEYLQNFLHLNYIQPINCDLSVTGTVNYSDEDLDGSIDSFIPELDFQVAPTGSICP
ncbi:MAG: hypothetical protein PF689_02935 [Deltaproteobacteria bacterium]|nr:hypothetical protein [Deltaproteobacteria bacterium]